MATQSADLTVFVIDGDPLWRDQVALLLGREGIRFQLFPDTDTFLSSANADLAGCALAEWTAPQDGELPGIDFLKRLRQRGTALPVFFAGAPSDPFEVRAAFRAGAGDFLFKPVGADEVLRAVEESFVAEKKRLSSRRRAKQRDSLFSALTRREREVASLAAQGHDNQLIGRRLGISHRTVEVHKSRLMKKLGARSLADLIRLGQQITK